MEKLLLKPTEAAEVLGIARSRMYVMLAEGEVPFVVVGRKRLVPIEPLRKWVEERSRTTGTAST